VLALQNICTKTKHGLKVYETIMVVATMSEIMNGESAVDKIVKSKSMGFSVRKILDMTEGNFSVS